MGKDIREKRNWSGNEKMVQAVCYCTFSVVCIFLMVKAGTGRETLAKRFSYIQNEISMSMTRQYIPTVAYMAEGRQEQTLSDFCWKK